MKRTFSPELRRALRVWFSRHPDRLPSWPDYPFSYAIDTLTFLYGHDRIQAHAGRIKQALMNVARAEQIRASLPEGTVIMRDRAGRLIWAGPVDRNLVPPPFIGALFEDELTLMEFVETLIQQRQEVAA